MPLNVRYLCTLVCTTYCHVCLSHGEGVVPVRLDGYTNLSVATIDLRIISMWSHVRRLFSRIEDGQSSYCWLRFDLVCRRHPLVLSGITRLFPIDRTNGCDYSYQSLANNPFGRSPTPFPSIVHSSWLLGVFPEPRSLTKVVTSREFVATFRYLIL